MPQAALEAMRKSTFAYSLCFVPSFYFCAVLTIYIFVCFLRNALYATKHCVFTAVVALFETFPSLVSFPIFSIPFNVLI